MKRFVLGLVLLFHLAAAPVSLADTTHDFWHVPGNTSEQTVYGEEFLPCAEIETLESMQKNAQNRVQHEHYEGAPDTSDQHHLYDFVIDHHKCDWIIRSSEPDP